MSAFFLASCFATALQLPASPQAVEEVAAPEAVVVSAAAQAESSAGICSVGLSCESEPNTVNTGKPRNARQCTSFDFKPLDRIVFDFDKDVLDDKARRQLDAIAAKLIADHSVSRIMIRGHTDYIGSVKYNDGLSDNRAEQVRKYLLGKGLAQERMELIGYGEHDPNDENWTREGRHRNRRVELYSVHQTAAGIAGQTECAP